MYNVYIIPPGTYRRFLNAYKRYKSYYPIKYPKYKKIPVLNNGNDHNSNNMKNGEYLNKCIIDFSKNWQICANSLLY